MGLNTIDANNEVLDGITQLTAEFQKGNLVVCSECKNTIREIQTYVWDGEASKRGDDKP